MSLRSAVFPPERRRLPAGRWLNVAARTVHLAATGTLLGGHVFDAPIDRLWPLLAWAIVSGGALIALEVYPSGHWLHQGCALTLYAKLALLVTVPWWWEHRVPILLAVVVLASVGSHAPRWVRHYSVIYRRVMAD